MILRYLGEEEKEMTGPGYHIIVNPGDHVDFTDEEAERLISSFPGEWEEVS